eukprot:11051006-Heterocapsa_arctica.AAC.1
METSNTSRGQGTQTVPIRLPQNGSMPTISRNFTGKQTSASPKHQEDWWLPVQVPFYKALPFSQGT